MIEVDLGVDVQEEGNQISLDHFIFYASNPTISAYAGICCGPLDFRTNPPVLGFENCRVGRIGDKMV